MLARQPREVDDDDVEHRKGEDDEQHGDAQVEPRRRVDRTERAGSENHDHAEQPVDERHRPAIGGAEQEAAPPAPGVRAGADDREVDRHHRQHARRQIQRQAPEKDDRDDGERAAAVEESGRLDAGFGVVNERQEVGDVHVAAGLRAGDRELIEPGQATAGGRRRGRARDGRTAWPLRHGGRRIGWRRRALAEGDAFEEIGAIGGRRGCCADVNRPVRLERARRQALKIVAGLVAKPGRNHEVAGCGALVDRDLDADGELALEDRDLLIEAGDLDVDRGREHDFRRGDAGRRHDPELRRNQRRFAGLVRLDVVALGE